MLGFISEIHEVIKYADRIQKNFYIEASQIIFKIQFIAATKTLNKHKTCAKILH